MAGCMSPLSQADLVHQNRYHSGEVGGLLFVDGLSRRTQLESRPVSGERQDVPKPSPGV